VTLLPRIAVECEPRETRMYAVRQFASPAPGRRIGLVWRKNAPRQEDYRLLARLIRAHVPKGGRRIDPEQTEKPETPKKAERLETPEKPKKPDKPKKRQMGRSPR
ncbi:MAG: hypothetical protein QUU85_06545, partial [Candidatus Eisenbacteria bacterium]|nr:hypothetical protein [Candidatus Eisenbacteria bacterium]